MYPRQHDSFPWKWNLYSPIRITSHCLTISFSLWTPPLVLQNSASQVRHRFLARKQHWSILCIIYGLHHKRNLAQYIPWAVNLNPDEGKWGWGFACLGPGASQSSQHVAAGIMRWCRQTEGRWCPEKWRGREERDEDKNGRLCLSVHSSNTLWPTQSTKLEFGYSWVWWGPCYGLRTADLSVHLHLAKERQESLDDLVWGTVPIREGPFSWHNYSRRPHLLMPTWNKLGFQQVHFRGMQTCRQQPLLIHEQTGTLLCKQLFIQQCRDDCTMSGVREISAKQKKMKTWADQSKI